MSKKTNKEDDVAEPQGPRGAGEQGATGPVDPTGPMDPPEIPPSPGELQEQEQFRQRVIEIIQSLSWRATPAFPRDHDHAPDQAPDQP